MITCSTALQIIENSNIGKVSEIGLSPFTNEERVERGSDIGPWMIPKNLKNINDDDSQKIVLSIKVRNTNKLNFKDLCERVAESSLLDDFYFFSFQKKPVSNNTYDVKLQTYDGKTRIAKIYPKTQQYYVQPFEFLNKNLFTEVPNEIELNNKACYYGSPLIVEE